MKDFILAMHLVAFDIIENKMIDLDLFHKSKKLCEYNNKASTELTKSEYAFLKEFYQIIENLT